MGETQKKMELFVKESFEAKDELFPDKTGGEEELPVVVVNGAVEDPDLSGSLVHTQTPVVVTPEGKASETKEDRQPLTLHTAMTPGSAHS